MSESLYVYVSGQANKSYRSYSTKVELATFDATPLMKAQLDLLTQAVDEGLKAQQQLKEIAAIYTKLVN